MGPHQLPNFRQLPGPGFRGRLIQPARVSQPRIGLQVTSPLHRRVTLALPAVHHVQSVLQLRRRLAGRGLGPLLANPLRTLENLVGLGQAWRVGRDRHPQPGPIAGRADASRSGSRGGPPGSSNRGGKTPVPRTAPVASSTTLSQGNHISGRSGQSDAGRLGIGGHGIIAGELADRLASPGG
jgi:hypothetical protein